MSRNNKFLRACQCLIIAYEVTLALSELCRTQRISLLCMHYDTAVSFVFFCTRMNRKGFDTAPSLSPNFNNITSIKSFDFSTLYTTIPHDKLKSRLASIIRNSFMFKNGNRRYKYLVLGHEESNFVKEHSVS